MKGGPLQKKLADPYLSIVDFDSLQHYKNRNPIWIKLYSNLWDNHLFESLADETKAHFIGLCVLASKHDNQIPFDKEWIARKISANKIIDFASLFASGLLAQSKRTVLARSDKPASLEREESREEEKRSEKEPMIGEFSNVSLSLIEVEKLELLYGIEGTKIRVEKLSTYMASKGVKYKSHYATILTWESKNGNGGNGNGTIKRQFESKEQANQRTTIEGLEELLSDPTGEAWTNPWGSHRQGKDRALSGATPRLVNKPTDDSV